MAASEPILTKKFKLNNGVMMPAIGFGTYHFPPGDDIMKAVDYALDAGYRLFDTAGVYISEEFLKAAFSSLLPKYGLEREDIFITTKLSPFRHGNYSIVEKAYFTSITKLGCDYADLYLIHYPGCARIPSEDQRNIALREETWHNLVELYEEGTMSALGVSNYTINHLKQLMENNDGIVPTVNQVEWHPYYHQNDLLNYCNENDILIQAYSSFGGTSSANHTLMHDPVVVNIAKKLCVTPAQLLLAWALQQGVAVIPKSANPVRIKENITLDFTIPPEDMDALSQLGVNNIKYAWDPTNIP